MQSSHSMFCSYSNRPSCYPSSHNRLGPCYQPPYHSSGLTHATSLRILHLSWPVLQASVSIIRLGPCSQPHYHLSGMASATSLILHNLAWPMLPASVSVRLCLCYQPSVIFNKTPQSYPVVGMVFELVKHKLYQVSSINHPEKQSLCQW